MALSYDHANTGIFTAIGKLVKYFNTIDANGSFLAIYVAAIHDTFNLGNFEALLEGIDSDFKSLESVHESFMVTLGNYVERRLTDRVSVIDELKLNTTDITSVLIALIRQMIIDGETINRSTVTATISRLSANVGSGKLVTTTTLDGFNSPGIGMIPHEKYSGVSTELSLSETMTVRCEADESTGAEEGSESFRWNGQLDIGLQGLDLNGSGEDLEINPVDDSTIISNGDFDNITSNVPDDWTLTGVATIAQDTGTHSHRTNSAIRFTGDGTATIGMSQAIPIGNVDPLRRYLITAAVKTKDTFEPSGGNINLKLTGTGYTATAPTWAVKTVQISGTPTGGSYTLTENKWGQTTGAIAHNATSATVQTALRALIGYENVVVATSAGSPPDVTHSITCYGIQGDVTFTSTSSLTGGTPVITHASSTTGVEGDSVVMPATALDDTLWGLIYAFVTIPAVVPEDLAISFTMTSTLTSTKMVIVDTIRLTPVIYANGIGAGIICGSTEFAVGDKWTIAVVNNHAGVFQKYFKRRFGVQLPSSGSPSIDDALAT